jgi:hypothetical protein
MVKKTVESTVGSVAYGVGLFHSHLLCLIGYTSKSYSLSSFNYSLLKSFFFRNNLCQSRYTPATSYGIGVQVAVPFQSTSYGIGAWDVPQSG